MENKNMTALVSCFVRAYHYRNNSFRIFSDPLAEKILSREEYGNIAANMSAGIKFFCPDFVGTEEDALRQIVDNQLSPSVLGRSAFCEKALINEMRLGCNQYIMYASGYETLAYKECFADLVYEIVGPVLTKWALTKSGDITAKPENFSARKENAV
ncbi:MAG: class I SAM-dependent methyltransferase [Acutalibacteraceae bacterium]